MSNSITKIQTISTEQALKLLVPSTTPVEKDRLASIKRFFNPLPEFIKIPDDQRMTFTGTIKSFNQVYVPFSNSRGATYSRIRAENDLGQKIDFLLNHEAQPTYGLRQGVSVGDIIKATLGKSWIDVPGAHGWPEIDEFEVLMPAQMAKLEADQAIIVGTVKKIGPQYIRLDWPFCDVTIMDEKGNEDTFIIDGGYKNCETFEGDKVIALARKAGPALFVSGIKSLPKSDDPAIKNEFKMP